MPYQGPVQSSVAELAVKPPGFKFTLPVTVKGVALIPLMASCKLFTGFVPLGGMGALIKAGEKVACRVPLLFPV